VEGIESDVARLARRLLRRRGPWAAALVRDGDIETLGDGGDRETRFEIGSISKGVTGCLYVDAVERGELRPDTVLGELLPLEGVVGELSLESLSRHRSGLPRLPSSAQPWRRTWDWLAHGTNPYGDTLEDLLEQVEGEKVAAPRPAYSNLGFQLLGHAVAAAAGTTYAELVRDRPCRRLLRQPDAGGCGVVHGPGPREADRLAQRRDRRVPVLGGLDRAAAAAVVVMSARRVSVDRIGMRLLRACS
jgi:CubicO group peptidase (beta-lactamase class C family)